MIVLKKQDGGTTSFHVILLLPDKHFIVQRLEIGNFSIDLK